MRAHTKKRRNLPHSLVPAFLVLLPMGCLTPGLATPTSSLSSIGNPPAVTSSSNWWNNVASIIVDAGFYPRPINADIVRTLRADVLDRSIAVVDGEFNGGQSWPTPQTAIILAAHLGGARITGQSFFTYTDNLDRTRKYYSGLPASKRWTFPNGTVITDPLQAAMVDVNGKTIVQCDFTGTGCRFVQMTQQNPGWMNYLKDMVNLTIGAGADGYYVDNMFPDYYVGGGFDVWSVAAFRNYLASIFTTQQLQALGIANLGSFDHGVYFRSKGYTTSNPNWGKDPIWRAFIEFELKSYLNNTKTLRDTVKAYGANLSFHGNAGNDPWISWIAMVSSIEDITQVENAYTFYRDVWGYPMPGPMQSWLKIYYSFAFGSKPVWSMGTGSLPTALARSSEDLAKFLIAEAYASGVKLEVSYSLNICLPNVPCVEEFLGDAKHSALFAAVKNYNAFIQAHKNLFSSAPASRVAVVYSVPTIMWKFAGPGMYASDSSFNFMQALLGYGMALETGHIPYDILTFGHPQFMNDSLSLASLRNYDVVILPNVEDISRTSLAALQSYVQSGGTLVVVGVRPTSDEDHNPLLPTDNSWVLGQGQRAYGKGTIVGLSSSVDENNNEASWYFQAVVQGKTNLLSNLGVLINAVNVGYKGGLQVTAPSSVVVDSFSQPSRQILHLLNYNATVSNIQVSWKLPSGANPTEVILASPDLQSDTSLPFSVSNGVLQFTVPSLKIWDMVIAGPSLQEPERGTCWLVLDASPKPGYVNKPVNISGVMYGSWRCIRDGMVVGKPVTITASWGLSTIATTDYYGRFSVTTNCPSSAGTYQIAATFYEDQDLRGNSTSILYVVTAKIPTSITVSYVANRQFEGYLRRADTGAYLAYKPVKLTITYLSGGTWQTTTYDLQTRQDGYYSLEFLLYWNSATVTFEGDETFAPSSATITR